MIEGTNVVGVEEARQAVQDMARRVALLHMCYARVLADDPGRYLIAEDREAPIPGRGRQAPVEGYRSRCPVRLDELYRIGSPLLPVGVDRGPVGKVVDEREIRLGLPGLRSLSLTYLYGRLRLEDG